ncbi:hypothetical protein [Kushneria aurantia]|uniref:Glyoxalase-like domain-containing protein n=1 Tax=Kushneria aurantia TaxID=504092 RepID=A0ABV6G557_9GAMM|nr:hypothetical protein [Kushneria aurantia]
MEHYPDIEVYLDCSDIERIAAWLSDALQAPVRLERAGKRQWRALPQCDGLPLPILLVEAAADRFASLWLDSDRTPWPRDADCAREASRQLECEVRCSLGGWQPGDDPDRFFQVKPDGSEGVIHWPDAGA